MASNIYTAKMKTVTDTSTTSSKPKIMTPKKVTTTKIKTSKTSSSAPIKKVSKSENKKITDNDDENKKEPSKIKTILDELKTTVSIESMGKTPSGLDSEDSAKEAEKSNVKVKNDKGEIDFIFWTSNKPTEDDVINYLVKSFEKSNNIKDSTSFAKTFGFESVSEERANSAFNGYKKMIGIFSKMFTEDEIEGLKTGNLKKSKEKEEPKDNEDKENSKEEPEDQEEK